MGTPFLDNLKKAVDTGEFNSEAAKKIIKIDEVADKVTGTRALDFAFDAANKEGAIKSVTEEEAAAINSEYEKKMQEIREKDLVLQQIATLKDIEETVMLSIGDMRDFILTLELSFDKAKPIHADLFTEIEKIKLKYSSINN